jgi:predicted translation initiation factor SUI1
MGKKNRSRKLTDPGKAEQFHVNPFADLDLDLPEEPQAEFPKKHEDEHAHTPTQEKRAQLDPEDQKLLKAFTHDDNVAPGVKGLTVKLSIERKGRGGKTVTVMRGLEEVDVLDQMEICRQLRTHLGTGGRFDEGVLELQGDQRKRAADWLQTQGYRVKGG